jgi:hypothetical protein
MPPPALEVALDRQTPEPTSLPTVASALPHPGANL